MRFSSFSDHVRPTFALQTMYKFTAVSTTAYFNNMNSRLFDTNFGSNSGSMGPLRMMTKCSIPEPIVQQNSRHFLKQFTIYQYIILKKVAGCSIKSEHFSSCRQLLIRFCGTFDWLQLTSKLFQGLLLIFKNNSGIFLVF